MLSIPASFKGGQLHDLFKDAGALDIPENYRDILLADDVGKAIQSADRPFLNENIYRTLF